MEPQHKSAATAESLPESPQSLETPSSTPSTTPLPWWYLRYRGKPVYHGNPEAYAWCLDAIARALSFIAAGAFMGTALLNLAKEAAGCETEPPPGETEMPECHGTVYGFKPSSLLTTYTIVIGLLSSALMPLMGAIVDYTPHRLKVGRFTSIALCTGLLPQIYLSKDTWFAIAMIQIFVGFIGWAQTMITYSYLPELTEDEDILNDYTKSYTVIPFAAMVVYLAAIVAVTSWLGLQDDEVASARIAMATGFVFCATLLYLAWAKLMKPRPAAHVLPEGQSLWTAGFVQVYRTTIRIYQHYPALKWFYLGVSFCDAAVQALATIIITYLTDQMAFTSRENGIAILIMLISSIPGAMISGWCTRRFNPRTSSVLSVLLLIVNTAVASLVLRGPGQQLETYILVVGWGMGAGWKWTCDRLVASSIIPPGQDAELMGYFLFAGQVLTWLPPLVFTALNEAGVSQRIGIASLICFFLLSLMAYFCMGDYSVALEQRLLVVEDEKVEEGVVGATSISPTQEELELAEEGALNG